MSSSDWFDDERDDEVAAPPPTAAAPRPRSALVPTLTILVFLALLAGVAAEVTTDVWWYDSVGYRGVYLTELLTKVGLFVAGALVTGLAVGTSLWAAYKTRPFRLPITASEQVLEQYRLALEPLRRLGVVAVPTILGLLAGAGAMGAWQTWLLWRNAQPFGRTDAQFGLDLGFFVFDLPWIRFVVSFLGVVLTLALVAAVFTHYVYGGLQLPGRGPTSRAAYVQIGVTGALLALVRGGSYWLDRYGLLTDSSQLGGRAGSFTGLTWTAAHAVLPTKSILAGAAVVCAGLWVASIWTRSWRLPLVGVALLAAVSVLVGAIYPALVQSLKVKPSEQSLEAPFIQRNIDATRQAFGLDAIDSTPYSGVPAGATPTVTQANDKAVPGVRLNDPNVIAQTLKQKQGSWRYYTFPDTLDVDRYVIDGQLRDAVVAVREVTTEGIQTRNWINDHTVYTHGYGFYAAYGNRVTDEGDPVLFSSGQPTPLLGNAEQRIYFGELSPDYSIVGAPAGSEPREVDYPEGESEVNNTYQGTGGVAIGSRWRQFVYAVKYREPKFLLSDVLNDKSRLLDHRTPRERVERVAPWLTLDDNVYPAVVDGRIQWIVEGFTTTASYPNSQLTDLTAATSETTGTLSPMLAGAGEANYVRNSIKATVDAFDGTVRLYAWEPDDPLLKAWSAAFPDSVRPMSQISASLMSHLRYPADLLKIQRQLVTRYHVLDPGAFYTGQDFWRIPKDPAHPEDRDQPVYYQSVTMPGASAAAAGTSRFSVTTTFVPGTTASANGTQGNETLRAFLAVDGDAGSTAGTKSPGYGAMRLLTVPGGSTVLGPGLVQNRIEASTERSQNPAETLNLRSFINTSKQQGSQLTYGNLLTLPFGGGFLNVQPLFIQTSKSAGSFPQMKAVVAMYGDQLAWGTTLPQAIGGLFGGTVTPPAPPGTTPPATGTPQQQLAAALADIETAYAAGQAALKKGDFAAYGAAQKRLEAAIARAQALAPSLTGTPSPTATAGATPTPSPSATG